MFFPMQNLRPFFSRKMAVYFLAAFFFFGSKRVSAYFGDQGALELGLKTRTDIIFFSGFESDPWTSNWGLAWGPEPPSQGTLITGKDAFERHSLRVKYPKGTFSSGGGLQSLTDFSKFPLRPQQSLYFRYYVRFEPGFDFVKGGKLPGLAGGKGNTGGHKPNGTDGWSARVMWRADGKIVQYVYHPDQPGEYGEDFDWNYGGCPRFFVPGKWYCLETFVHLNSPGKKDGIIRSWLDGDKALEITNLRFRDNNSLQIDKLYFETFFGGGDPSWGTPKDQYAEFDNFVMATNYIGPVVGKTVIQSEGDVVPASVMTRARKSILVFRGGWEKNWSVSHWSDGIYDLAAKVPNRDSNGSGGESSFGNHSVLIQFPDGKWGGVQFGGNALLAKEFKLIRMAIFPTGCDVEYRVRFELNGAQVGVERAVTPGPRHGWKVNRWDQVELSLMDFQIPDSFDRIVINSNSSKAVSPFYLDDVHLEK